MLDEEQDSDVLEVLATEKASSSLRCSVSIRYSFNSNLSGKSDKRGKKALHGEVVGTSCCRFTSKQHRVLWRIPESPLRQMEIRL